MRGHYNKHPSSAGNEPLLEQTYPPTQPQRQHASNGLTERRLKARRLGRAQGRAVLEHMASNVSGEEREAHRGNGAEGRHPHEPVQHYERAANLSQAQGSNVSVAGLAGTFCLLVWS